VTIEALSPVTGSTREVVSCVEYGTIPVDSSQLLSPGGKLRLLPGVLDHYVRADFKDGALRLVALGFCGLIPLTDDIAVQVNPRFPVKNLTRMVRACGYAPTALSALRGYARGEEWDDWLLDVLADALLGAVETIAQRGLLRVYQQRREVSSFPHGRIDTNATMLRLAARGVRHQAEYSWFERTVDTASNRVIKGALAVLHARCLRGARRKQSRLRIARLASALYLFRDVPTERYPDSLDDATVRGERPLPETRDYYRPALDVSVMVLSGKGIDLDAYQGSLMLPSLLVKTEDLFESYVRLRLQTTFTPGSDVELLDGNGTGRLPLYEPLSRVDQALVAALAQIVGTSGAHAEPDLVFRSRDGTYPLVADVKYTELSPHTKRSEVEQVMLYGQRYRSPIVMTVHPKADGLTGGLHLAGKIGSSLVTQYRVDLAAEDLDAEIEQIATAIRALLDADRAR